MNNQKNQLETNLRFLRNKFKMSQEFVADQLNVSRQSIAKWENGETLPDIMNCDALAELFDVSLSDLLHFDPETEGVQIGPKDKHVFGTITVGERGQIVLPKKARDVMEINPGDVLVVLGDTNPSTRGLALISDQSFLNQAKMMQNNLPR